MPLIPFISENKKIEKWKQIDKQIKRVSSRSILSGSSNFGDDMNNGKILNSLTGYSLKKTASNISTIMGYLMPKPSF